MIVWLGCALMAIGSGFMSILLNVSSAYFFVPSLVIFVINMLYARAVAFRCPRCRKDWSALVLQNTVVGIDKHIHHCPFCGLDIDAEIDPVTHKPIEFLREESGQSGSEIKNAGIQLPPGKQKANTDIQLSPDKEERGTAK
jgi:hypothetical protein